MARKLTWLAYTRLESLLNSYKTGKAPVDYRFVYEALSRPGASVFFLVVLIMLVSTLLLPGGKGGSETCVTSARSAETPVPMGVPS